MYWADKIAQAQDKNKKHRVDDMSSPSGHYHVGSIRAIATHGLVYEAMKKAGYDVDFTYVINDMDPMDGLPVYLESHVYGKYMGKPLNLIPAPDGKSATFADQYAGEYLEAANILGFKPKLIHSSELYKSGKMNDLIRLSLDGVGQIRKIYLKVANQKKPKGWYPFQVICPKCNKVGTSLVTDWDGQEVTYECKADLVKWAVGCGHRGKVSPFNGNGKLMWKVDWPAHWVVLNITVEGAGKEHDTAGGSRDVGVEIVKKVFKTNPPFGFLHEFLLIGGAKMSGSKGNAMNAIDFVKILPPELGRFLIVRVPYQRAIDFDPTRPETIPDIFDEYDKCAYSYFESGTKSDFGRFYEASQLENSLKNLSFIPRFRTIVNLIKAKADVSKFFEEQKGNEFSEDEKKILDERVKYADLYLKKFASAEEKTIFLESVSSSFQLTNNQKNFLGQLANNLSSVKSSDREIIKAVIFETLKKGSFQAQEVFKSFYQVLIGKDFGPKAADLILEFGVEKVVRRLNQAAK